MSVYRKNKQGQLVKIAGNLTHKLNMAILRTVHTVENNADYYDIDETLASEYINSLTDNTYYILYLEESNETETVYIRYRDQVLQVSTGINTNVPVGTLYGRLDLFTLDSSKSGIIIIALNNSGGGSSVVSDSISETLTLGMDGIIEAGNVVFEVQNANSFLQYRTNQRRFIMTAILPVVGPIDLDMPVRITFGDTVYNLYSYTKDAAEPLVLGDIMSNHVYNTNIGYKFALDVIFINTSDIKGFVLNPNNLIADQLVNILDDSDTVIVSLDETGTKVQLHLASAISNKLAKMLVTPMTKPTSTELVAIGTDGMQERVEIGDGLSIVNGKLVSTVASQIGEINQLLDLINGEVV